MRVLIYEFVTGGGTFSLRRSPEPVGSFLSEGAAMIGSLAADFLRLPGAEVFTLRDSRLADFPLPDCVVAEVCAADEERRFLSELAARCDATIVIAPEFGGALFERARIVSRAGGHLLSPGPDFIAIAADKTKTAAALAAAGVSVPFGVTLADDEPLPADFPFPAVCKPNDGAGSADVQFVASADQTPHRESGSRYRLEQFCPGIAASVAVLCGPNECAALPACSQRLTDDGAFRYLGGETPLAEPLAARARWLALAAVAALPTTIGYVGVDLVLGDDPDGADDVVIEINPRLTTSYVGLRAAARGNLAQAMLDIAAGRACDLSFRAERIEFDADGAVREALRGCESF